MPTPEIAPNTVETRISISELRLARSRSDRSPRRTASVSTIGDGESAADGEVRHQTWVMATMPISTPPPIARFQIG